VCVFNANCDGTIIYNDPVVVRYKVLKNNRKESYPYIRVHHLQPEDYPARMEFCTWLLNQEISFHRFYFRLNQILAGAHNWHIWAEENPTAIFPRAFQERFSVNL
jgi:hypothetical protein